jgi:hypothetical protein
VKAGVESPILKKEITEFLKSNPKIQEALETFNISEEQVAKAMQSMEPRATTSNKIVIEIEA